MLLLVGMLLSALPFTTALVMPQIFNSHMVLQRAPLRAKLYGTVEPASKVTCTVDGDAVGLVVQADGEGRFVCELAPYALSWNRTVTVAGDGEMLLFSDVAFGDVVLCLGSVATAY